MTAVENDPSKKENQGAIFNSEIPPTIENIKDNSSENILRVWEAKRNQPSGRIMEQKTVQNDYQELVKKAEKAIQKAADVMRKKQEFNSSWEISVHIISLVDLGEEKDSPNKEDIPIIKEWVMKLKDPRRRNHEGVWFSGYDQESRTSNVYDTSFAIVALLKAKEDPNLEVIKNGINFIERMNDSAYRGWPAKEYEEIDVGATSWAIIALKKAAYRHVFSWDEIPGKDNGKLIEFLAGKFDIDWIKNAKIEKIDVGKIIKVYTEKNSLSLRLNDKKNEVNLEIDDVRTDKFIAKTETGNLNIYPYSNIEGGIGWLKINQHQDGGWGQHYYDINNGRPSLIAKTSDAVAALLASGESPNKSPEIKDAVQWMIERQSIQEDEKIDEWVWSWGKNETIVAHDVENTSCAIITLLKCAKDMDLDSSSAKLIMKLVKSSIEWLLKRQKTDGTWEDDDNWGSSITPRVVSCLNCFCKYKKISK